MAAFNAEKYIADSIKSVTNQSYPQWELLVVDDGSTDRTAEIVAEFVARDSRIKYIYQQNSRLGAARNAGIRNARGELFAFLDSDDLWLPTKLETQLKDLEESKADFVFSNGFIFWDDQTWDETAVFPTVSGLLDGAEMHQLLLERNPIPVLSVLVKRRAFDTVGHFEESAACHGCEDYDLWLKLAESGILFYGNNEKLVRYRRHARAMTYSDANTLKTTITVLEAHLREGDFDKGCLARRLKGMYWELIFALAREDRINEARRYMPELIRQEQYKPSALCRAALLRIFPRYYTRVIKSKRHAMASFSYRTRWLRTLTSRVTAK